MLISNKAIWRLTWPQLLLMFCQFTVGFTDVFVAGRIDQFLLESPVAGMSFNNQAAFGLASQCLMFCMIIGMVASTACVSIVSQSFGAKRLKRASWYIGLLLAGSLALGIIMLILCYVTKVPLLHLLSTPDEIFELTLKLWGIYILGLPVHYLFAVSSAAFRARKEVLVPLLSGVLVCTVNAVGDFGFGLGLWGFPFLGAEGIAWTTFFAALIGCLCNMIFLVRRKFLRTPFIPPLRWIKQAYGYLIKVALPAGGMQFLWQFGYLLLFKIVASLPNDSVNALSGFTVGMRIESLLFLPALAFNMTASVLVGNFLGAGLPQEAHKVGKRIILFGCLIMSFFAVCFWPFLKDVAAWVAPSEEATNYVILYLQVNVLCIPFTVASMILSGIFMGAGATIYGFIINSSAIWFVRLPIAYLLGHYLGYGALGIFIAMFISQCFQSLTLLWAFLYRSWTSFAMRSKKSKAC